jgi:hypothetical protein
MSYVGGGVFGLVLVIAVNWGLCSEPFRRLCEKVDWRWLHGDPPARWRAGAGTSGVKRASNSDRGHLPVAEPARGHSHSPPGVNELAPPL